MTVCAPKHGLRSSLQEPFAYSLVSALCTQILYLKKSKALIMHQGVPQRIVLELPCKCGHDLSSNSFLPHN